MIMLGITATTGCSKDETPYAYVHHPVEPGRVLVVYFTRTNTTGQVAERIAELTGADVFRIETATPYPSDYDECTQVARREKENGARPAIAGAIDNIDDYDTVFLGFPIWWSSRPMVIATFLDTYNLDGKNLVPFCTHGGGGTGAAFAEVVGHTPGATHVRGLSTQGAAPRSQVEGWLNEIFTSY